MRQRSGSKLSLLAASVALAMATTSAMAADPAAGQLPGQGKVTLGTAPVVVVDNDAHTMVIPLTANNVIDWGAVAGATDINHTGTAGFNIGVGATVTFSGAFGALNIDSTGNPSQIFGTLTNNTTVGGVYVANGNGIVVGTGGTINGSASVPTGLIGNTLIGTGTDFTGNMGGASTNYIGTGGDVTVQKGAATGGAVVLLVSGGGTVNVDLSDIAGTSTVVSAGVKSVATPLNLLAGNNPAASAIVTGANTGTTLASLASAGTATTHGRLTITANDVAGLLTNTGDLTLHGGAYGNVHNQGILTTDTGATFGTAGATGVSGSLTNDGTYDAQTDFTVNGGALVNNGSITHAGNVLVNDGTVVNNGSMADVLSLTTASDSADAAFAKGGQYFITNAGTITSAGSDFKVFANTVRSGTANDSRGSFTNTGTLQIGNPSNLTIYAWNNLSLGGTLQVDDGTGVFKTVSNAYPLVGTIDLEAAGYDGSGFATAGVLTISTPVVFDGTFSDFSAAGVQVKLMGSVTGLDPTDGSQAGSAYVVAGPALKDDYALRIASGQTLSAANVQVDGDWGNDDNPNVILQGTVSGNQIQFGSSQVISDLFSGPNGGLVWTGLFPEIDIAFTGAVRTAPYLNDTNNFRYNYLPINNTDKVDALWLKLNPVAYTTNGTSNGKSAVNVLVDGDVTLAGMNTPAPALTATAVTGVTNWPNTHLVLQSTGDITTYGAGTTDFYWPGYVYLGTIDSNIDGSPAPGTLGATGKITLAGDFNNVLPGDVAGASGIHFITANKLDGAGTVSTNANALVNFGTDLMTQNYAQGLLTQPAFAGGVASGLVVNYGTLDSSLFHTAPPSASR